jgi:hypothetical protein
MMLHLVSRHAVLIMWLIVVTSAAIIVSALSSGR